MSTDESVTAAARAVAEATSALSKLLAREVVERSDEVGRSVADSLRSASRGLDQAADSVGRARLTGGRRGTAETREVLLDAAAALVAERGCGGASLGEIAASAGFTKGAVYSNFPSKEDLLAALSRRELSAGRVVPDRRDSPPSLTSALLAAEILAQAARNPAAGDVASILDEAIAASSTAAMTDDELIRAHDDTIARLAISIVGTLVESVSAQSHGTTARLLARLEE